MLLVDNDAEADRLLAAAAAKIRKVRYCWLLTAAGKGAIRCRPMGRVPRDAGEDEWTLRFITDGRSPKVADMRRMRDVSVIFQHEADDVFVALSGQATLAEDKAEIRRRWTTAYDAYFPGGPERSSALFVKIDVARVELWIRGVTAEPYGLRTTVVERETARGWRVKAA